MSVSEWVPIREAAAITGRTVATLYGYARRGTVRSQWYGRGRLMIHRDDVERLAQTPKHADGLPRIPHVCQDCAWRRQRECAVFTELWPEGWRTPDGGCQAYAGPAKRRHILEQIVAYSDRAMARARRVTA